MGAGVNSGIAAGTASYNSSSGASSPRVAPPPKAVKSATGALVKPNAKLHF